MFETSGQTAAAALNLSLTNVYAIKSRLMKEIKGEVGATAKKLRGEA